MANRRESGSRASVYCIEPAQRRQLLGHDVERRLSKADPGSGGAGCASGADVGRGGIEEERKYF